MYDGYRNNYPQNHDYKKGFRENTPLIHQPNFTNMGTTLHNNLYDKLNDEHITEYTIHISSRDRDISKYPSQFKFKTSFGQTENQPNIGTTFRNVKYIKIPEIIIPVSQNIVDNEGNYELSLAPTDLIENCRFLFLRLKELQNAKMVSTSSYFNDGINMYPDKKIGSHTSMWTAYPFISSFVYQDSSLLSLTNLTIELRDDQFNLITMNGMDKNIINQNDIRNPLNRWTQFDIRLIIGVVEVEMGTMPKFTR